MFSILIPTWNNLPYLKLCVDSLRRHCAADHEIIIHVNDGSDGTLGWVRSQGLKYSHSANNIGVCLAVNYLAAQAKSDWLLYANDDMVFCPGWDSALRDAQRSVPTSLALFSPTMIEPEDTGNPDVVVRNYGRTPAEFEEARLLQGYRSIVVSDREGRVAQPTLVHRLWWQLAGGYSLEFSPGMSSDDDLLMKFWIMGCRNFRIVGNSIVYHFCRKSTARVRRNRGSRAFVMKWGLTQRQFKRDYLLKSADRAGFPTPTIAGMLKRIGYSVRGYPLNDLGAWDRAPGHHLAERPAAIDRN